MLDVVSTILIIRDRRRLRRHRRYHFGFLLFFFSFLSSSLIDKSAAALSRISRGRSIRVVVVAGRRCAVPCRGRLISFALHLMFFQLLTTTTVLTTSSQLAEQLAGQLASHTASHNSQRWLPAERLGRAAAALRVGSSPAWRAACYSGT